VLALPNVPNPAALSYQWTANAALVPPASGVGASRYSFIVALPLAEQVEVTMRQAGGTFEKTASVEIQPVDPSVGVYAVRKSRGVVFEKKLDGFDAPSGEPYDFAAAPFFFPAERQSGLSHLWTLNGKDIVGAFAKPWLFTLTSNPNTPARDFLHIRVEDPLDRSNRASADLTINLR
jgi:hypothetical protein